MTEKETVVRTVLFSHIMQDDQDALKAQSSTARTFDILLASC